MIMSKVIRSCVIILVIFISACASDGWYEQSERERFLRLNTKEQKLERIKCHELWGRECEVYKNPTPEEQERLKNKDSWEYKLRSLYYRVW